MCTAEETKTAIIEVLYEKDHTGDTVIGREINAHITNKGNQIIAQLTIRFGITLVVLVLSVAAAWYALYYKLEATALLAEQNRADITNGGYLTTEAATRRDQEIQRQFAEQNDRIIQLRNDLTESMNVIRTDLRDIRNILISL